jgi:hypothetical protein
MRRGVTPARYTDLSHSMSFTDTHRTAEWRREAFARRLIKRGVWAAWLFATLNAITAVMLFGVPDGPDWRSSLPLLAWAASLIIAARRIQSGGRADACVLFVIFFAGDVMRWFSGHRPGFAGLAISVVTLVALASAVLGTFALARLQHDADRISTVRGSDVGAAV